jgi:hypothetical protein
MAVSIVIAGTTYNFPESGESPNWGPEATDAIVAMANAINTLLAPGDILQTSFSIDNNIAVAANINGLLFDSGTVRAANVSYAIYRTSTSNPAGNAETGLIKLIFDDDAPVNEKWKLSQDKDGESGVTISIGDDGQLVYKSSDIGAVGYSGTIRFAAKALSN